MTNIEITAYNEKAAREYAATHGINVGKRVKNPDGSEVVAVGSLQVSHNGQGGKGCWRVDGTGSGRKLGEAIIAAVIAQA